MWQALQQRLRWQAYRLAERLGTMGLLALALGLLSVLAFAYWLRPLQLQLHALQQATQAPSVRTVPQQTPAQQLQAYLQQFPSIETRANATQAVIDIAAQQDLMLDEVSYKTDIRQGDPIAHYHMRFSLYASYAEVQAFLSQLLHDLNHVEIASLSLSRENVGDELIEAQIELVLHFKQAEAAYAF